MRTNEMDIVREKNIVVPVDMKLNQNNIVQNVIMKEKEIKLRNYLYV